MGRTKSMGVLVVGVIGLMAMVGKCASKSRKAEWHPQWRTIGLARFLSLVPCAPPAKDLSG